ncbi:MAG: serine hydrolase [Saprospiraceae bacterium]|nr:serine hydrolase [Saprospiraceae bacterium]
MRTLYCFGLIFCCLFNAFAQDYSDVLDQLDKYIEQARVQWEVPGLAVAIVKDGKALWSKGYGVKEIGKTEPVNIRTLFGICSTTKAMTAACIAMLVDEGKIGWDDKVFEIVPDFRLSDPHWTREIRIRDLLTHNTGLGNADLLWYLWDYEPQVIIEKMRYVDPAYPVRGGYTYQNNMYALAGKVIENVSGKKWESFIQERIFNPLKMDNTFPTQEQSIEYENRSKPHSKHRGAITVFADESADKIAPAGAVWSTIEDMQKWMLFVLDSAKVDGERLISDTNYREWLKPQTIVSDQGFYPTQRLTKPHWKTYALGWFQHDYLGRAVSFHTGSLQGTIAIIGLIPDENLGVYVLGNLDHAEVRHAIMYTVFDIFQSGNIDRDWSSELLALYESLKPKENEPESGVQILPSFLLKDFTGMYEDDYLGQIEIVEEDDHLLLLIGPKDQARLIHKNRNTFSVEYLSRPYMSNSTLVFEDNGLRLTGLKYFNRTFKKK